MSTWVGDLIGGGIVKQVGDIVDDVYTSKEEELQLELKRFEVEAGLLRGQHEINKAEAEHISIFVAGWRPAIGWLGAIALGYEFLLRPMLMWIWVLAQGKGWIPADLSPPPATDAAPLFSIVTGMLGVAGLRTYEKFKKVDTKRVGKVKRTTPLSDEDEYAWADED